jgi:hypothetical protein
MRARLLAGVAAGFAMIAAIGCDPSAGKPNAAGEGGSPPPEDSQVDKNAPPKNAPPPVPGETPKGKGGIAGPPKRGGGGPIAPPPG